MLVWLWLVCSTCRNIVREGSMRDIWCGEGRHCREVRLLQEDIRAWVVARIRELQDRLEIVTNFSCLDIRLEMTGWMERQMRRMARYAGTPGGRETLEVVGRKVASQV